MSDDLISRQAAIDAIYERIRQIGYENNSLVLSIRQAIRDLSSAQRWIPVKTRPMTEEERQYWEENTAVDLKDDEAVMFDCKMPEDGQEIWVCSKCGNVWEDTCVVDEGIGLEGNGDWLDIVAWMPFKKPEPWKEI